jgi:hypothetical protein
MHSVLPLKPGVTASIMANNMKSKACIMANNNKTKATIMANNMAKNIGQ